METSATSLPSQTVHVEPEQQTGSKQKRNILLPIILIFLAIISVITSGFIIYKNLSNAPSTDIRRNTPANWKTYTNDTYGFSFSFPEELTYIWGEINRNNDDDLISILFGNFDASTRKSVLPSDFQLVVHVSNLAGRFTTIQPDGEKTPDNLNGVEVIRTTDTQDRYGETVVTPVIIFSTTPNRIAINVAQPESTNKAWFDEIANTFVFTKQQENTTQIVACTEKTTCAGSSITNLGCANPAATFCTCMGGSITTRSNDLGQFGVCTLGEQTIEEWEYFYAKTKTPTTFTCPETEWMDCYSDSDYRGKQECSTEYISWSKLNCDNFKGAAF